MQTYGYHLDAFCGEVLSRWLGRVAGNAANPVLVREHGVGEDGFDDGAALVASGTEDCENF